MPQILLNCYLRAWWFSVPGLDINLIWNLAKECVVSFFYIGIMLSSRASQMLYTIIFKSCRKTQKYEETSFKSLDGSFEGQIYFLCLFYKRVHKIMPKKTYLFTGSFIVFTENNPADLFETHICSSPSQWAGNEVFSI